MANRKGFLLAAPGLETRRALEISGLDRHFAVHESLEQARSAALVGPTFTRSRDVHPPGTGDSRWRRLSVLYVLERLHVACGRLESNWNGGSAAT